MKTPLYSEIR